MANSSHITSPGELNGATTFRGRTPKTLAFGTSGLRGLVTDITDLEAYINTRGFLTFALESGAVVPGPPVCLGADLRPSSDGPERSIVRAVARAVTDSGMQVDWLGKVPTPALACYALQRRQASIMVTGSHIPFDRNGIKFNLPAGEILKRDELAILRAVERTRALVYSQPAAESPFEDNGMFKPGRGGALLNINANAHLEYLRRYLDFIPPEALKGRRLVFYEHSAVGRDLLVPLLRSLGAEVIPMGRSETFVPVDTEAITDGQLKLLQDLAAEARREHGPVDAIVSTDGDSDRPLVAGLTSAGLVHFCPGDLLGILAAEFLGADAVVAPISVNDAVDQWAAARGVKVVKTRIGSPFVIEGMERARNEGAARVVGWEANGGFLTTTPIEREGRLLAPLPTRDAALPLLAVLCAASRRGIPLVELFAELPRRYGKAGLLDDFPVASSGALRRRFAPPDPQVREAVFAEGERAGVILSADGQTSSLLATDPQPYLDLKHELEQAFCRRAGFDGVTRINFLDGVRVFFRNGDIAHVRPSGNAPQLRIYAVADAQARADEIVELALREPDGILRCMQARVGTPGTQPGFAGQIGRNIALTNELFARGETPGLIGTVSGSAGAQQFWQDLLDRARDSFKAASTLSFVEDLPTNQAFGLLLLWQRLKPHWPGHHGALVAFVFGDGTRSTPFTETDGAQKPAMATFVPAGGRAAGRFLSMAEAALRYFVPVQQYLRRSGFDGLVVKWGDEVQIPTRDLSGRDSLFQEADVVRFVSMRTMNDDEARNKDWVGVDDHGRITAFIPRRPLDQMEALANRGLLQRRGGQLWGGVNLGSIAVSRALLDCLLDEFRSEVNDPGGRRQERPALDPEFFTALTIAAIEDAGERTRAWERAMTESTEVWAIHERYPDLLERLGRAIRRLEQRQGHGLKMVAMDFGRQYWGDIGQHQKIYEFYMALNQEGPLGEVARAMAGLDGRRDARGNLIIDSVVSPAVQVRNSVLIGSVLLGRGSVEGGVLIGTRAVDVRICDGFDVLSTAQALVIEPRGGTYKVVANTVVHAGRGERWTTLFLPELGPRNFRVREDTDLKDKARNYARPILGNPLSFQAAHAEMGSVSAVALERQRRAAELKVQESRQLDRPAGSLASGEPLLLPLHG